MSRDSHPSLPGRLADCSFFAGPTFVPSSGSSSLHPVRRVSGRLKEVLPGSFPGSGFLGSGSRLPSSSCPSSGPADCGSYSDSVPSNRFFFGSHSPLAAVPGTSGQSQGLGDGLSFSDSSFADLFPAPLPPLAGLTRPPDPVAVADQGSLSGVGVSRASSCGETFCSSPSLGDSDHRRFQPRFGCFFAPSSSLGPLVTSGSLSSHQSSGVEDCLFGPPGVSAPSVGSFGPSQVRQLDSSRVYQSPGRNSFGSSLSGVSPSAFLVSSGEKHSVSVSHSGSAESCRGLPFQGEFSPL